MMLEIKLNYPWAGMSMTFPEMVRSYLWSLCVKRNT